MELNPLLMNTEDLLRYGKPESDLEIALFGHLQEYSEVDLDEYEELKDQVASLDDQLDDFMEEIESLNRRIEDLTDQLENRE